ncbi:MAG TPA: aromatic-ring-hydroxylating dioxygenase subunit beta [Burkholderiales bacterium]|nr:aromatic-ring-hydroxylating dioxygenase subunit beta [Burkholderiales bacterium]
MESPIDPAFYDELVRTFSAWPEREVPDPATREHCRMLLHREARLLDQGRFDDWLALYAAHCVYWIPATPGGDPRREVAVAFDDRRRLEDRVYRLGTGNAWSQLPASRTVRLLSNIEVFPGTGTSLLVRSNFLVSEWRAGETHLWSGWCGQRLRLREGRYEIEVRQVNLIDCDQHLRNPSLIL